MSLIKEGSKALTRRRRIVLAATAGLLALGAVACGSQREPTLPAETPCSRVGDLPQYSPIETQYNRGVWARYFILNESTGEAAVRVNIEPGTLGSGETLREFKGQRLSLKLALQQQGAARYAWGGQFWFNKPPEGESDGNWITPNPIPATPNSCNVGVLGIDRNDAVIRAVWNGQAVKVISAPKVPERKY